MNDDKTPTPERQPTDVPRDGSQHEEIAPRRSRASASRQDRTEAPQEPHSIYTLREKWCIVILASYATLFSPLTANIYFPAIPTIAQAFHKSTELINLTVTIYMVMQGVAPMFWGTLADRYGRRLITMTCLTVLCLTCIGMARIPTNAYWLLMLLRCLQAAGGASTVAISAGIIGDITIPAERGGFFGVFGLSPMAGITLGPVIGGGLAQSLGWRSIFWFLLISAALCLLIITLILPETLRSLVGNGSIVPSPIHRPLLHLLGRNAKSSTSRAPPKARLNPFILFTHVDVLLVLILNGLLYSIFYAVVASISTLFQDTYPFLNETDTGLCFLAVGGGMVFGTISSGWIMDREYQTQKRQLIKAVEQRTENKISPDDVTKEEHFPIEKARLRTMPIYVFFYVGCCIGNGWCLQAKTNLAGPLLLQMGVGYTFISIMNASQTLLVDLLPGQSSSITACNNFVRCLLGAAAVSVVDILVKAVGVGWAYVILGAVCVLPVPLIPIIIRVGPKYRARRREKANRERSN